MTTPPEVRYDAEASGTLADFGNLPVIGRERTLAFIPITKIIPSDTNPRTDGAYDSSRQYALRRSIERHGILQPLVVQAYTRDLFRLVEGHRRYEAARTIGVKELPAVIVSSLSTVD